MNTLMHEHVQRIANKTNDMAVESALQVLKNHSNATLLLNLYAGVHTAFPRLRQRKMLNAFELKVAQAPTGYSAVDGAMKMMNNMIEEAETKYEVELERCCSFDKSQSALMEATRQAISHANAMSASAKKEILEANSGIATCEKQIPALKLQLSEWVNQCEFEIGTLDGMLTTINGDINVIATIIESSKCENAVSAAMMLYECSDECGNYETVGWGKPMSPRMQALALKLVGGQEPLPGGLGANLTTTSAPPRKLTRSRPCKAPRNMDPASAKCTITKSPQCAPLLEKFYNIQTGLIETQRELEQKRSSLAANCAEARENFEAQIAGFEQKLKDYNTALAGATAVNSEAIENSRLKGVQLKEFMKNYEDMTEECHSNYDQLEAEICALTKIRGDVFNKLKGNKDPAFFTDCKVSDWVEVEPGCSVSCAGGTVKMVRTIDVHPVGGAACPALEMVTTCNLHKCPIDCRVGDWSGWSDCSAKCGGGVQDRSRPVVVEPMYKGDACGDTEQVQNCNPQSCDVDCVLSDWTLWTNCSKSCNTGHKKRMRTVLEPAVGGGSCADIDGPVRLAKQSCNPQPCLVQGTQLLRCESKKDVILLIDGSGSVQSDGWKIQLQAARMIMKAIDPKPDGSDMSIIVYSGPKWLCDYYQCMGAQDTSDYFIKNCAKDASFDCGTQVVSHLTTDLSVLEANLSATEFPRRTTFTSKALAVANSELAMGQKDAEAVVIVMTDGYPADKIGTAEAAHKLNEKAKVIWVPITQYAPLSEIKSWAADPENVIPVQDFSDLTEQLVNDITATACTELNSTAA